MEDSSYEQPSQEDIDKMNKILSKAIKVSKNYFDSDDPDYIAERRDLIVGNRKTQFLEKLSKNGIRGGFAGKQLRKQLSNHTMR